MDDLFSKHLLILGFARQGIALARFAVDVGAQVTVSDMRQASHLQSELAELSDLEITFVLGEHPPTLLDGVDIMAISGGVPADAPIVQLARQQQIPIVNDSLLFEQRCPAPTIGITGSAGKTTTTTLLGMMCRQTGVPTWVGGNIGNPLITNLAQIKPEDYVVHELSSFQLEIWNRSPKVAMVLNLTPNHLDRHITMEAYASAKGNILRFQQADDIAVLCADDEGAMALKPLVKGKLRTISCRQPILDGAYLYEERIWLANEHGRTPICHVDEIQLRGKHNIYNVLAAVALADSVGIKQEHMRQAIQEFSGVPHRLELVRLREGVQYVNDSIATAPERALAALHAFSQPVILLAGGRDKNMVWDNWAETVRQRAKAIVLFGELADPLEVHLRNMPCCKDSVDKVKCSDYSLEYIGRGEALQDAVTIASQIAGAGDVVLLSPGGTSYDAFHDFSERGDYFRELVRSL